MKQAAMAVKRKLNESDIPTPVTPDGQGGEEAENEEQDVQWEEEEVEKIEEAPGAGVKEPTTAAVKRTPTKSTFESFGLDGRLLQAIASEGFSAPTNVQSRAIPLALQGRDILARAKTGSGKTAAYVLPILQSLLKAKAVQSDRRTKKISALILVPTKELSSQVSKVVSAFAAYCAKDVRVLNLAQNTPDTVQRSLLAEYPDVVVATPARVKANLDTSAMTLDGLTHLVIDEADLVLSYGYEEDLQHVARAIPKGVQTFLMSATLSTEVDTLKGLFCRDPAVLELDEAPEERNKVTQYVVKCGEDEKFLLLYVIVKLKLIKGKMIIFVADIDRCYRVKLYLEQFGVKSCVLNSELPVNSRIHVVEEFNKNVYNIIIASDEHEVVGSEFLRKPQSLREIEAAKESKTDADGDARMVTNGGEDDEAKSSEEETMPSKKASRKSKPEKKKRRRPDREYGISRGIDFKNVACVLNFDLPPSATSYTHRIGRTARANKPGTALSFVVPSTLYRKHKAISTPACENDEAVLAEINKAFQKQTKKSPSSSKDTTNPGPSGLQAYAFDMTQIDPFRYRTSDALRAVTRAAIREARTSELRAEILKSEKLKRHFEENPDDLRHLRHDGELRAARVQPHLKHVPDYLKPKTKTNDHGTGAGEGGGGEGEIFVGLGLGRSTENRIRKNRALNRAKGRGRIAKAKKAGVKAGGGARGRDPLKTFNARGRGKK